MDPDSSAAQGTSKNEEYRALYQAYVKYCNEHDFAAMESFYTPTINVNDRSLTPTEVTAQFKPTVAAFPDWHWDFRKLTIEGDYLALHFQVTGTHQGDFLGIAPTGRPVTVSEFTLYQVKDGKFAAAWDLLDMDSLVKQIK